MNSIFDDVRDELPEGIDSDQETMQISLIERREKGLSAHVQELLDMQADALLSGNSNQLQNARTSISTILQELHTLASQKVDIYANATEKRRTWNAVYRKWGDKTSRLKDTINEQKTQGPLHDKISELRLKENDLEETITSLAKRLDQLRAEKQTTQKQREAFESQLQARTSSYEAALEDVESQMTANIPPKVHCTPAEVNHVLEAQQTLLGTQYEHALKQERALQDGIVCFDDVLTCLAHLEAAVQQALAPLNVPTPPGNNNNNSHHHLHLEPSDKENINRQVETLLSEASATLNNWSDTASKQGWSLLCVAVGQELAALQEALTLSGGTSLFFSPVDYGRFLLSQVTPSFLRNFFDWRQRQQLKNQLENARENASSYQEWLDASLSYDELMGWDLWKDKTETDLYDYKYIQDCTNDMRKARLANDRVHILFHIWTRWSRNIGNINNPALYTQSCTGTKLVIENYIRECERCLDVVLSDIEPSTTIEDLLQIHETLTRTKQRFGRTALLLSGGGTMGMLHNGVLACLLEQDLLPQIINGSSAGSIVASVLCSSSKDELQGLLLEFGDQNLNVFESGGKGEGFFTRMSRFLKDGSWIDGSYLSGVMKELLGDLTFREAYYRTRRILNITVSSASIHEPPRLLNYLTAPEVVIYSAVCASCSVPLVFLSHALLYKDPVTGQVRRWDKAQERWIDGSVANDVPIAKLAELFNVNLFIVSQVNPHVVPFVKDVGQQNASAKNASRIDTVLDMGCQLAMEESKHILAVCTELGIAPVLCKRLTSVLSQRYSGDINIFPKLYLSELAKILKNPTVEFMTETMRRGQQSTWPKITLIRHTCAVEFALESAIVRCRTLIMEKQRSVQLPPQRLLRSRSDRHMGERPPKILLKKSMVFSIPSRDLQPYSWVVDAGKNFQDGYNYSNFSLRRSRARTSSSLLGRLSWNKLANSASAIEMTRAGRDIHRSSASPSRPGSPSSSRRYHFRAPSDPGSPLHLFVPSRFNEDNIKNRTTGTDYLSSHNDQNSEIPFNTVPLRKTRSNKGSGLRGTDSAMFPKLPAALPSIESQDNSESDKVCYDEIERKSSPAAPSPLHHSISVNKDKGSYNVASRRYDIMPPTSSYVAMRQSRSHSPLMSPTRSTHLNGSNISPVRHFNDDLAPTLRANQIHDSPVAKLYRLNGSALFDERGKFEGFENPEGVFDSSEEDELLGMFGRIPHSTAMPVNDCQHEQYVIDSDEDSKIGRRFLPRSHSTR